MKKSLFLLLALLVAACVRGANESEPIIEVFQCGNYKVFANAYVERTDDLSGGWLIGQGGDPAGLNSSDIVKWPVIIGGDGDMEIWSKSLKTADGQIIFQLVRHIDSQGATHMTEAAFSDSQLFRNGMNHIKCEYLGTE